MFEGIKDMGKMLKQAKEMKSKMADVQKQLKNARVTGQGAGGQVAVEMTGEMDVVNVTVAAELLAADQKNRLENAIKEAVNQAAFESKKLATSSLSGLEGFDLPGLK